MDGKKKVNIGLDIGITSVGWAIINADEFEIIDAGSRIFAEADSKNNQERREKRSSRRMNRRDKLRRKDLLDLFVKYGLLEKRADFFDLQIGSQKDVYQLRKTALTKAVSKEELMMILYSMMKRRGTFSWLDDQIEEAEKSGKKDGEFKTENDVAEDNRFACEIQLDNLAKESKIVGTKNKDITHEMYEKELNAIFAKQEELNGLDISLKTDFLKIFNRKLDYYQGPNDPSPFGWNRDEKKFYENLIGYDTYDKKQMRAPRDGVYAALFNLLNDLNGLSIIDPAHRDSPKLTKEEKEKVIASIYNEGKKPTNLTLSRLRTILSLDKDILITGYRIDKKGTPVFTEFKVLNEIYKKLTKNSLPTHWLKYANNDILDAMSEIFTKYQSVEKREEKLSELIKENHAALKINDVETTSKCLSHIKFSGSHAMSNSTIHKVLPEMLTEPKQSVTLLHEKGIKPEYRIQFENTKYVPVSASQIKEMYISPVVKRAFIQSLKVLKEIQRRYRDYEISNIVIELAREKNSDDFKKHINEMQKKNEEKNKIIRDSFAGRDLRGKAAKKARLYLEQHQMCAYCGEPLDRMKMVDNPSYTEIDHIIPESISYTSSMDNLVLVHSNENHAKGQKTPYGYFTSSAAKMSWSEFQEFVRKRLYAGEESRYFRTKIENLLDEKDYSDPINRRDFINRNLNDTRYATAEVKAYLDHYVKETNQPFKIQAINGRYTDYIKKEYFDLGPKDRDDLRHHAIDAIVIASSPRIRSNAQLTLEGLESKKKSFKQHRGDIMNFDYRFSRMSSKNLNKQLTNETLYVYKKLDENDDKSWTKIEKCKLFEDDSKINDIFGTKKVKTLMEESDPKTFTYLQKIYDEYMGKTYKNKDDKEIRIKNPFVYVRDILKEPITKQQSEKPGSNTRPVKVLKYYSNKIGKHLDVTHKYQNADFQKTKLVYESFKPFRVDIFKNKLTGKFKVLFVNASLIKKTNDQGLEVKSKEYQDYKTSLGITSEFQLYLEFYPGDTILYKYVDDIWKICKVVGGSDNTNIVEIAYLHRNKHVKYDEKFPDKKIDERTSTLVKVNQIIDIKLLNLDVLGVKSSKYALE